MQLCGSLTTNVDVPSSPTGTEGIPVFSHSLPLPSSSFWRSNDPRTGELAYLPAAEQSFGSTRFLLGIRVAITLCNDAKCLEFRSRFVS